jgi:hypothetical protein
MKIQIKKGKKNMCIAIYKPKNTKLKRKALENSAESNPDGFGVGWSDGKKLKCFRTMKEGEWIDKVMSLEKYPAIIHARIKTHGKTDLGNCHPFRVEAGLAFIHNGVLPTSTAKNPDRSDTWHFNELILKPLVKKLGSLHQSLVPLLVEYARGSKLVFLDYAGRHLIVNESAGHWHEGAWFSNCSYKEYEPFIPYKPSRHRSPYYASYYGELWEDDPQGLSEYKKPVETFEKALEEQAVREWEKKNFHDGK